MIVGTVVKLQWHGPYRWYGTEDTIFTCPEAQQAGIYLQTIPLGEQYLTYYVGETGRSFAERFEEHTRDYLYGYYRIFHPQKFAQREKELLWQGRWKRELRDRKRELMVEFLNQYMDLAPRIHEFLGLFRIFVAPLDVEDRIRKRVEAAIANWLRKQPNDFQDEDVIYRTRRQSNEERISITMAFPKSIIIGLCNQLTEE